MRLRALLTPWMQQQPNLLPRLQRLLLQLLPLLLLLLLLPPNPILVPLIREIVRISTITVGVFILE